MRVALAQTKPVTGDLEGNTQQIVEGIRKAKQDRAEVVLFPETAITGYCCGALYEQEEFIEYNLEFLEKKIIPEVTDDLVAIVGFVDRKQNGPNGQMRISNSAAVIQNQQVLGVHDKILLANGEHHEDKKYFTPGKKANIIPVEIRGKEYNIGVAICEDVWMDDHQRDIVEELVAQGANAIFSPNFSYFYTGKQEVRRELYGRQAKEKSTPFVAVNAVGVGDIVKNILIYDGASSAYNKEGKQIAELPRFKPAYELVDLETRVETAPSTATFNEEIFDALVFEQKEFFGVLGLRNAQVHISGGIDSAVVGALVVEAMGQENTYFITNPTEDNTNRTLGYAHHVASALGVELISNPTQQLYKAAVKAHTQAFGETSLAAKGSYQAILRTAQANSASHTLRTGVVACGNHTEIVEGWATFHDVGSMGAHSLIGDLTKLEVFSLAKYINQRNGKEIIPVQLYDGREKPAAELADAAEDPLDYFARSGIAAEIIRNRKSINRLAKDFRERKLTPQLFPRNNQGETIYERYDQEGFEQQVIQAHINSQRSVYKAAQAAPIVIVAPRSRGFSNRETIINAYQGIYDLQEEMVVAL